jgi:hypothetical protein
MQIAVFTLRPRVQFWRRRCHTYSHCAAHDASTTRRQSIKISRTNKSERTPVEHDAERCFADFDQTLSFNDSGIVLSDLLGISGFAERIAGLSRIHLVQQGGELASCMTRSTAASVKRI